MQSLHIHTVCSEAGTLTLRDLPILVGEAVEVVITSKPEPKSGRNLFPLRGELLEYKEPFEPVAADDWEALR